jgi:hypothetical protein
MDGFSPLSCFVAAASSSDDFLSQSEISLHTQHPRDSADVIIIPLSSNHIAWNQQSGRVALSASLQT